MAATKRRRAATEDAGTRGDRGEQILAAARALFERRGHAATTMAEIAQSLGLAEGTVYLYYPSKRDLLVAVALRWFAEITDATEREIAAESDLGRRLELLLRRHLEMITGNAAMYLLFMREIRAGAHYAGSGGKALTRRYTDLLRACLPASGTPALEFPLARDIVYGGTEHVAWSSILHGQISPARIAALAATLAQAFGRALGLQTPAASTLEDRLARIESALGLELPDTNAAAPLAAAAARARAR